MKRNFLWLVLFSVSLAAQASTTTLKQIDNIQNSTGGSSLAVPSVGATLDTNSNTLTLTNKTISGASNTLSNISLTSSVTGVLPVANGGTGASTLTANNVILGNGTSAVQFVAPGTSGNVLQSNGTTWVSGSPPSGAPTVNNSQASPQSVTAGGGISLSAPTYANDVFVKSNSGAVTVTATPSITACTAAGQTLDIFGEDATNVITLQDESGLSGSKLRLNGNYTTGLNTMLSLNCDGNGFWVEKSRQN